jgi:hypothetical protein
MLDEGATAQSHDPGAAAAQFFEHTIEGCMFDPPELPFSGNPEDVGNGASLALFDAVVQILKDPIQPLPEGTAHAAFAGAHEAD